MSLARSRWTFTITDLGLFLGKSPVTLRGWERQGLVSLPRDSGENRKLTTDDVRKVVGIARDLGRISQFRKDMVCAVLWGLETIEKENQR